MIVFTSLIHKENQLKKETEQREYFLIMVHQELLIISMIIFLMKNLYYSVKTEQILLIEIILSVSLLKENTG